jgi:hypothetical protein
MEDILDMADQDSDLRAFVITNEEFTMMDVGNEMNYGNSDDIAHTIVFTDFVLDEEFVDVEILQLEFAFDADRDDEITGLDPSGDSMDLQVADFAVLPDMSTDELVELVLEDGEVIAANVLLDDDSDVYEVIDIDTRDERITLDLDGTEDTFWLAEDYVVFGAASVDDEDMVSVVFNPEVDSEIEIIYVR